MRVSKNISQILFCRFSSRNSSTKDLTQFAAEAIAFNRQLSQHDEQQEDVGAVVCTMRLSPPSNSRLARRRAQSNALRTRDFIPSPEDFAAWGTRPDQSEFLTCFRRCLLCACACVRVFVFTGSLVGSATHCFFFYVKASFPGPVILSPRQCLSTKGTADPRLPLPEWKQ